MTEYVDGKKYRVTRDYGELTYRKPNFEGNPGLFVHPVTGPAVVANSEGVTAEPIPDPLPTTQGSVVRVMMERLMCCYTVILADGGWIDDTGTNVSVATLNRHDWTLIYDAGAQQS